MREASAARIFRGAVAAATWFPHLAETNFIVLFFLIRFALVTRH
jgi:hypothetical protein